MQEPRFRQTSNNDQCGVLSVQCVLVARMVLQDEFIVAHITAGRWEHRRLWLDLPGDEQKRNRATQSKKDKAAAADVEMGKL